MKSAIFICTHGRQDKQITLKALRDAGYTGLIVLVTDDEDKSDYFSFIQNLHDGYLWHHVFNKQKIIDSTNTTNFPPNRKTILYAKNACEQYAKQFSLDCFAICDDDIPGFRYRYIENGSCKSQKITKNMDKIIQSYMEFVVDSDITATSFGMAQFYFAGENCFSSKWRVPYTFVFRNTKYRVDWVSDYGEDITTAIECANQGKFMIASPHVQMNLSPMGVGEGGMVELHKDTFRLSEYGHVWHPVSEQIRYYKDHWMSTIKRDNAFPMLISSKFKHL